MGAVKQSDFAIRVFGQPCIT